MVTLHGTQDKGHGTWDGTWDGTRDMGHRTGHWTQDGPNTRIVPLETISTVSWGQEPRISSNPYETKVLYMKHEDRGILKN